ncbi:MAG: alpha/beta fold hydrolase [Bdellovibrionales bacterium]|nr:alpha/beta fold hydrolase [Bdellovibrionales bacterium]
MNWQTSEFCSFDDINLHYRYTDSPAEYGEKVFLHLHRGHEHSGRIVPFAEMLNTENSRHFAFDLRGHGMSEGPVAWAENFQVWVKDLNSFVTHLRNHHAVKPQSIVIVANSVGAIMATSWILRYNPKVAGCILGAPAFSINLYVPLALPSLRALKTLTSQAFVTSYVKSSMLTNSEAEAKAYDDDPLITKKIGVNVLVTLFDEAKLILSRAKDFETPVLILSAGKDYVVKTKPQRQFFEQISSDLKRFIPLPNSKHAVFHETNQQEIAELSKSFVRECFDRQSKNKALALIPEPRQHTLKEFVEISGRRGAIRELSYWSMRALLKTLGKWSQGMSLGLAEGFNSGKSLDYVYSNSSAGSNIAGKLFDSFYLNSLGWREVRKRKTQLSEDIKAALKNLQDQGKTPVILDIACGGAQYLAEALKDLDKPAEVHLNDQDADCTRLAKQTLFRLNKRDISIHTHNFDILNPKQSDKISFEPNLIIISGVLELYPDNLQVQICLKKLFEKSAEGAHILYTGQPWHPQLEMIGKVLNNKDGRRWIMRRRIQAEMDELIEASGFVKVSTTPNDSGIFSVSSARKFNIEETPNER